jgi:hypothetical protein
VTVTAVPYADAREHLADELRWLDDALLALVRAAQHEAQGNGLFVSPHDAEALLARAPGDRQADLLAHRREEIAARRRAAGDDGVALALEILVRCFALAPADELALVVALAGELDGRYGKLYGYLHDDLGQRRPSPQLLRDLVRLAGGDPAWALVHAHSAALRWGLVRLHPDGDQPAHEFSLDPVIASFLATGALPPDEDVPFVRRPPRAAPADGPYASAVRCLACFLDAHGEAVLAYFHGPAANEGPRVLATVCAERGVPVVLADLADLVAVADEGRFELGTGLRGIFRHARLRGAAVHLSGFDALLDGSRGAARAELVSELARESGALTSADGTRTWVPGATHDGLAFLPLALELPDFDQRRSAWRTAAAGLRDDHARALAARFRSTPTEIASAARLASARAAADGAAPGLEDMLWACRERARVELSALARVVRPRATWADLVAPDDVRAQLTELCGQVRARATVLYEWGFDRGDARGTGATALFLGPSGAGKTLAAEVIAHTLDTDLITVDLSAVVSKYIGETEKNLQRLISAADRSGAVLFFDEADALFGKRTEIRDAHDRYANLELSFLLQRLEDYEGVAILATNLAQNIDDAFVRRIAMTIEFPFPDDAARAAIWRRHIPDATPCDADVDFDRLGAALRITGGDIRKIAWNAAFLAADEGDRLTLQHIARAARREYARRGKAFPAEEMGP